MSRAEQAQLPSRTLASPLPHLARWGVARCGTRCASPASPPPLMGCGVWRGRAINLPQWREVWQVAWFLRPEADAERVRFEQEAQGSYRTAWHRRTEQYAYFVADTRTAAWLYLSLSTPLL